MSKRLGYPAIVNEIVRRSGVTKKEAREQLKMFTEIIMDNVVAGNEVNIRGFGSFQVRKHASKKCTIKGLVKGAGDEMITIKPYHYPFFLAGDNFRKRVKENLDD